MRDNSQIYFLTLQVNVLAGGADINGPILGSILRKRIRIEGTTLRTRSTEVSFTTETLWLCYQGSHLD